MTPTYSSAALKTSQREIKDIADREIRYITENGEGKHVLTSQEVPDRTVAEAAESALHEARTAEALEQSRADITVGRAYHGKDTLLDAVVQKRSTRS